MVKAADEDFSAEFDKADAALEDLQAKIQSCQQAIVLARATVFGGLAVLAAIFTVAPLYATATVIFAAITAILAGTVWLGATKSTKEELQAERAAVEARKSELFDIIANRNGWDRDPPGTYH